MKNRYKLRIIKMDENYVLIEIWDIKKNDTALIGIKISKDGYLFLQKKVFLDWKDLYMVHLNKIFEYLEEEGE